MHQLPSKMKNEDEIRWLLEKKTAEWPRGAARSKEIPTGEAIQPPLSYLIPHYIYCVKLFKALSGICLSNLIRAVSVFPCPRN
jgi:hypothetical protein